MKNVNIEMKRVVQTEEGKLLLVTIEEAVANNYPVIYNSTNSQKLIEAGKVETPAAQVEETKSEVSVEELKVGDVVVCIEDEAGFEAGEEWTVVSYDEEYWKLTYNGMTLFADESILRKNFKIGSVWSEGDK